MEESLQIPPPNKALLLPALQGMEAGVLDVVELCEIGEDGGYDGRSRLLVTVACSRA